MIKIQKYYLITFFLIHNNLIFYQHLKVDSSLRIVRNIQAVLVVHIYVQMIYVKYIHSSYIYAVSNSESELSTELRPAVVLCLCPSVSQICLLTTQIKSPPTPTVGQAGRAPKKASQNRLDSHLPAQITFLTLRTRTVQSDIITEKVSLTLLFKSQ